MVAVAAFAFLTWDILITIDQEVKILDDHEIETDHLNVMQVKYIWQ